MNQSYTFVYPVFIQSKILNVDTFSGKQRLTQNKTDMRNGKEAIS